MLLWTLFYPRCYGLIKEKYAMLPIVSVSNVLSYWLGQEMSVYQDV